MLSLLANRIADYKGLASTRHSLCGCELGIATQRNNNHNDIERSDMLPEHLLRPGDYLRSMWQCRG
jgi:hypothetical protein